MASFDIYQLRIALHGTEPVVWRQVVVPGRITFAKLHKVFQIAMGWSDRHLHRFKSTTSGPMKAGHEKVLRLKDVAEKRGPGGGFYYEYDSGDEWLHSVFVEKIIDLGPLPAFIDCLGGERACPPEDCGGAPGYDNLLAILGDPGHPEHKDRRAWVGADFEPGAFDLAAVRKRLKRLKV